MYDLIIIGGGPAGLVAAKFAAKLGKKVALIEKNRLGGSCTITGCIPSKTLINIANTLYDAQYLNDFNITIDAKNIDTKKVMAHVREMIEIIYAGHSTETLEKEGITVIYGSPEFVDQQQITCNGELLKAKKYILATGSRPFVPPIQGLQDVPYLTNESLFTLEKLPPSLLILGGGPIGIEMASCLQKMGTTCTIIEMQERILPHEDAELTKELTKILCKNGVTLNTGLKAVKALTTPDGIALECLDINNTRVTLSAEQLLIAVGRKPNSEGLGLDKAGVRTNKQGVVVTETLQTTAPHIYACGDIVGPYLFSHIAEYQASIATRNALFPFFKKRVNYTHRVWVTFSYPELASAGLTEDEARKKYGDSLTIYRSSYKNYDRPRVDNKTEGLAKFICDSKGSIIGAHILGARAGELIGEIQLGTYYNHKLADFYHVIHPYPTYSDLIWQTAKKAYVDRLQKNFWLNLLASLFGYKTKK